jgi:hypothetical protein
VQQKPPYANPKNDYEKFFNKFYELADPTKFDSQTAKKAADKMWSGELNHGKELVKLAEFMSRKPELSTPLPGAPGALAGFFVRKDKSDAKSQPAPMDSDHSNSQDVQILEAKTQPNSAAADEPAVDLSKLQSFGVHADAVRLLLVDELGQDAAEVLQSDVLSNQMLLDALTKAARACKSTNVADMIVQWQTERRRREYRKPTEIGYAIEKRNTLLLQLRGKFGNLAETKPPKAGQPPTEASRLRKSSMSVIVMLLSALCVTIADCTKRLKDVLSNRMPGSRVGSLPLTCVLLRSVRREAQARAECDRDVSPL